MRIRSSWQEESGQSTVELVALLPLLAIVGVAMAAVLSAGAAGRAASAAAQAGALAVLQEREPRAAVRSSLTGWPQRLVDMRLDGGRVTVEVRPRIPIRRLARLLAARSTADVGPPGRSAAAAARGGDGLGAAAAEEVGALER